MNRRREPRTGLAGSIGVTVALLACAQSPPGEGALTRAAVAARQQGRVTAVLVPVHENTGQQTTLQMILDTYSLVLARATTERAVQVQRDTILTWHGFRDAEWLSRPLEERPRVPVLKCSEQPPRSLRKSSADRVALSLEFGETKIYDIDVKVDSVDSAVPLVPGQQYLLVAQQCEPATWRLPLGLFGVVGVTADKNLQPLMTTPRPFLAELRQLGTIDALRKHLAQVRKPL